MKTLPVLLLLATSLSAHPWKATNAPVEREALRAHILEEWKREHAEVASAASTLQLAAAAVANAADAPATAKAFLPFSKLDLRADKDFLWVGSNGLPDHNMMVGITAWQQQVPLPQPYFDENAWRIPLKPVPAKEPAMIKGRFLRGAIALAVNGIPIFNPQNNRGEISQEIGELDQWGGHCGRADDYHYHIAPLHLQTQAGKGMPVAYALDGYPIFGLTEPDGSPVGKLDECHGHEAAGGYHYHASMKYPYVIGGFRGEVVERDGQADPQPRAGGMRGAGTPLRGATITGFERLPDGAHYVLQYHVNGARGEVRYGRESDGAWTFHYANSNGGKSDETYREGPRRGGPSRGVNDAKGRGRVPMPAPSATNLDQPRSSNGAFLPTSPVMEDNTEMPAEYTGDGDGATLPLDWKGALKCYWTLYDLPANLTSLPKNAQGIGKVGTEFKGNIGYEPPNSRGPGAKPDLDLRGVPQR